MHSIDLQLTDLNVSVFQLLGLNVYAISTQVAFFFIGLKHYPT